MLKICFATVATLTVMSGALQAQEKKLEVKPLYEQSRLGVTVRLEKVAVQSVLVESADDAPKRGQRSVSVFISVTGGGKNLGPIKASFANGYESYQSVAIFKGPPLWVSHVKGTNVDPKAAGMEFVQYVSDDFGIDELFPLKVTANVTTKTGEKVNFIFNNVRF